MDWNTDMEKAPRDGTEIIVYVPNLSGRACYPNVMAARWNEFDECNGWWATEHFHLREGDPNAWQFLPSPPTGEAS